MSGLAAAHLLEDRLGQDQRVLILDITTISEGHATPATNSNIKGAHTSASAHLGLATTYHTATRQAVVKELGVDVKRNAAFANRDLEQNTSSRAVHSSREISWKNGWWWESVPWNLRESALPMPRAKI